MTLTYERHKRRSAFREGVRIRLADRQFWALPAPPNPTDQGAFGTEYTGILRALTEADDDREARLTELSLVILLLSHNYDLSPGNFEHILGFESRSQEFATARAEFHDVAQEHLKSYLNGLGVRCDAMVTQPAPPQLFRLGSRLRGMLSLGR